MLSDILISFLNVILETSEVFVGLEVANSAVDTPGFFLSRAVTNHKVKFTKGESSEEGSDSVNGVSPTFLLSAFLHVFQECNPQ